MSYKERMDARAATRVEADEERRAEKAMRDLDS